MDLPSRARQTEIVLLFTAFIAATYGFGVYLFPAIVEPIRAEMGFSYAALGTVSGLVQTGFMVSAAAAGVMTLRFGAMPLILSACSVCAICLFGLAFAPDIRVMGALLVVLGGCAVVVWVPMVEVAREVIAPGHQGKALGLMSSGTSYGVFVNSLLMISVLPQMGWRWVWGITSLAVVVLALVGLVRLRGFGQGSAPKGQPAAPVSLLQRRRMLATRVTATLVVIMFLNGLACMPFQTYLSAYLQGEVGLAPEDAAFAWRLVGLVGMASGFLLGALADLITVRRALVLTHVILAGACIALVAPGVASVSLMTSAAAIAFGTAFFAIFGLIPAYISQSFGKGDAAIVFSLTNISLGLGGIAGNLAGGLVKEASGSFVAAYLAMGLAAGLSVLLSLALPMLQRRDRPDAAIE
ncbi:MAG: MFS transporter [Gemmobacter sp.]|jgi:predicted MFS family arabinose efflux permease|nr:MFS transporter [Gemmobacter sp.]